MSRRSQKLRSPPTPTESSGAATGPIPTARVPGRDPFTVLPFLPIGNVATLNLLAIWADDPATRHKILVDNPARFYGF